MQDRHRQLGKSNCDARPDHTFGSFAPHAVYVLQRLMSGAPRKRQLATEERRVVKPEGDIGRTREIRPLPVARGGSCGSNRLTVGVVASKMAQQLGAKPLSRRRQSSLDFSRSDPR